ncbi:DUF1800 domain-containing protein [Roseobacteraceae bacterium NS-SX3]
MRFDADLAAIRFGCGLSPVVAAPASAEAVLERLTGPDEMASRFPVASFGEALVLARKYRQLNRARRKLGGQPGYEDANETFKAFRRDTQQQRLRWLGQLILRHARTEDGLRERLALFWADHFTAQGKNAGLRILGTPYMETVIRPHVAGRFEDLLIAATTSPLMLHYLDQNQSAGPNSRRAKRSGGKRGLNENLAREVLELHTLGVGGPYTQADVRQLAELFTGLSLSREGEFRFRESFAEPGAETVLGRHYGGTGVAPVLQALRDLAAHPATARHLAQKLAVHFVSDRPDPDLVAHMAARYEATGGDLVQVYAAMLEHPAAWSRELANVKPPFSFAASACRALAVPPARMEALKPGQLRRIFVRPLALMGQRWQSAAGPDGWAEEDAAWITPQGLAARLQWAMAAPQRLVRRLPEPSAFAQASLGRFAGERVRFAARAAETEAEAIGLVLTSPAFQRR